MRIIQVGTKNSYPCLPFHRMPFNVPFLLVEKKTVRKWNKLYTQFNSVIMVRDQEHSGYDYYDNTRSIIPLGSDACHMDKSLNVLEEIAKSRVVVK